METLLELLVLFGFFVLSWLVQRLKERMQQGGAGQLPPPDAPEYEHEAYDRRAEVDPFQPAPRGRPAEVWAEDDGREEGGEGEEGEEDEEPYWRTEYGRDVEIETSRRGGAGEAGAPLDLGEVLRTAAETGTDPWEVIAERLRGSRSTAGRRVRWELPGDRDDDAAPQNEYEHESAHEPEVFEEVFEEVSEEIADETVHPAPSAVARRGTPTVSGEAAPGAFEGGLPTDPRAWAEAALAGAILARPRRLG